MATWIEDITTALINLGGVARLSDIYEETRKIRPQPHPPSFEAMIRGYIEEHSSDSVKFKDKPASKDLFISVEGLGQGIWGLRSSQKKTPKAFDIRDVETSDTPQRTLQAIYRVLRDTQLARQIKRVHKNCCQLCGTSITLPNGDCYSEAHHIKPLGRPYNGPDVAANIMILCPNHHTMLDYGVIELDLTAIRVHPRHQISEEFINYHNSNLYGKSVNKSLDSK